MISISTKWKNFNWKTNKFYLDDVEMYKEIHVHKVETVQLIKSYKFQDCKVEEIYLQNSERFDVPEIEKQQYYMSAKWKIGNY